MTTEAEFASLRKPTDILYSWALRHGISAAALDDLRHELGEFSAPVEGRYEDETGPEGLTQANIRLKAASHGFILHRNNNGQLLDKNGRPVRFGLANDSKSINAVFKSSDLIGYSRELVNDDWLARNYGQPIARFAAVEVKKPGFVFDPTDERQVAQKRFIDTVVAHGGYARFSTGDL